MKTLIILSRASKWKDCGLKTSGEQLENLEEAFEENRQMVFNNELSVYGLSDLKYDNSEEIMTFIQEQKLEPSYILLHETTFREDNLTTLHELRNCSLLSKSHNRNGIYQCFLTKILDKSLTLADVDRFFSLELEVKNRFLKQIRIKPNLREEVDVPDSFKEHFEAFLTVVGDAYDSESEEHRKAYISLESAISKPNQTL